MELKTYQKNVIGDLARFLSLLTEKGSASKAYNALWEEKNVNVGMGGLPYYHYNLQGGVPDVCFKVPTGGGKTFLAASSIKTIYDAMPTVTAKAVVWLVPSDAILTQTYAALSNPHHPYRQKIDVDFGGAVAVYSKAQLLNGQNFNPTAVTEQLSIFVLSYDSFRTSKKEGRKAYQENGNLATFPKLMQDKSMLLPDTDETALIQVIRSLNPVVIVDEVQTLPMPYLKPFTAALAELARKYGVIVVLCTATQPALDGVFADLKIDLPIKEICPNVPENFETFRRTKITQHTFDSTESLTAELTALPQVLCIVNRIADAQKIYQALPKDGAYCLTTHLCPAHRKARIKEIRERLKIGLPCRVVSTSLIEAGVDVDFPRVYREEAGLDSVLQAAGRCNREGKRPLDESLVTVFTVQNTTPPPYMRQPAAAMKNISKRMEDITSLAAIRAYFEFYRDLYGKEDLDREKILIAFENEMLPFASVAEKVRVIENCTTPVYIPIDQGEALVERLYRGERSRTLFRKLGQYSVNVYPQQLAALREAGAVQSIDGGALYVLADPRRYDSALGLILDQTETALFI